MCARPFVFMSNEMCSTVVSRWGGVVRERVEERRKKEGAMEEERKQMEWDNKRSASDAELKRWEEIWGETKNAKNNNGVQKREVTTKDKRKVDWEKKREAGEGLRNTIGDLNNV